MAEKKYMLPCMPHKKKRKHVKRILKVVYSNSIAYFWSVKPFLLKYGNYTRQATRRI